MSFKQNNILLIVIIIVIVLFIFCITVPKTFEFFEDENLILSSEYNKNIDDIKTLTSTLSSDITVLSNNFTGTNSSDITGNALRDFNYISNYINTNSANYLDYTQVKDKYKQIYNNIYQLVTDNNAQRSNYTTVS